ncbi:hypothetical protein [Thermosphaera sp.]
MVSENNQDADPLAIEFLRLVNDITPWYDLPDEVKQDKWKILAKRVMASSGDDIQEFLHNIIKSIAGDSFYVSRGKGGKEKGKGEERRLLGKDLEEYLKKVKSIGKEKELIDYIKSRAIPLIIRLSAKEGEA